jgi:hypothetical protein
MLPADGRRVTARIRAAHGRTTRHAEHCAALLVLLEVERQTTKVSRLAARVMPV